MTREATYRTLTTAPPPTGAPSRSAAGIRRLQRMGAVTTGVSLPREWVGQNRLSVGSSVYLEPLEDGSLVVRSHAVGDEQRVVEIQRAPGTPPEHLFRRLISAYLDGAQEFRIREAGGLSPETRSIAALFSRRTVHPEIVSEEGDQVVLRDVSRGGDLELAPMLRRMHQVVLRLHEGANATLRAGSQSTSVDWGGRDDDVDRHAWLVERVLTMRVAARGSGCPGPLNSIPRALVLVRSLERAADHAVLLADYGARWKDSSPAPRLVGAVAGFHDQARELLARAFPAALAGDAESANDLIDSGEALHAEYRTLVESMLRHRAPTDAGPVELALLLPSIDRTVAYAQDIAEAGLDSGVRAPADPSALPPSRSTALVERGGKRAR